MFRRSDQIVKIDENSLQLATVDVCGVQREVNISLVCTGNQDDLLGKWVLVHVGFAMSVLLMKLKPRNPRGSDHNEPTQT